MNTIQNKQFGLGQSIRGPLSRANGNFINTSKIFDIEVHDQPEYNYNSLSNYICVAVEVDGGCPGLYSMVGLAAVPVKKPNMFFYRNMKPITDNYKESILSANGLTREQTLEFEDPAVVMPEFCKWLLSVSPGEKCIFVSDNPSFPYQFVNYYLNVYNNGFNPFSYTTRSISDIFSGVNRDLTYTTAWKKWRKTEKNFTALNEAKAMVEAFRFMIKHYNFVERPQNFVSFKPNDVTSFHKNRISSKHIEDESSSEVVNGNR